MAALTLARGTSIFVENIFESRYKHVLELCRMGADITVDGACRCARRWTVERRECLRDGFARRAALVVAGLAAQGRTTITDVYHIDRGYENLEKTLSGIGAVIKRE